MATFYSTPTTLTVTEPGNSPLASLAASMSPNSFAQVSTTGWASDLFHMPNASDLPSGYMSGPTATTNPNPAFTYCTKAAYDPTHGKIYVYNATHIGDPNNQFPWPGAGYVWTYDLATNGWTKTSAVDRIGNSSDYPIVLGHHYEHLTVHPTTGDLYKRRYGGGATSPIFKLTYGLSPVARNWVQTSATFYEGNITGTLDYWPALNGGAGGLVVAKDTSIVGTNSALSSFTLARNYPDGSLGNMQFVGCVTGNYYNWASGVYNPQDITAWYRMDSSFGAITIYRNLPYRVGVGDGRQNYGVLCAHPNGVDLVLLPPYLAGTVYVWRASSPSSWQSAYTLAAGQSLPNGLNGVPDPNASGTSYVRCTLPSLGVIAVIHCNGESGNGTDRITLYKPPV